MRPDQIQYIAGGLPIPPEWGGMGGLYRPPDPRDRSVLSNPRVVAALDQGVKAADLIAAIGSPIYNQGPTPACASAGTCGLQSIDESVNGAGWKLYDWLQVYHENGGNDRDGIDPQAVLKDAVNNGLPLASGGAREKIISSYAFVPQVASTFQQTVTACIAAGLPVGLALLLPSPFGWNSGTARTQGYHWMCGVGSDPTWATCVNSWGDSWPSDGAPRPGLCRIPWSYLLADNLQNGLCFAFTTQRSGNVTPPPPVLLTVTGVTPAVAAPGQVVSVTGSGFNQAGLRAIWGGLSLQFMFRSDRELGVVTPTMPGTFNIMVSAGTTTVVGPALTVQANVDPPPPNPTPDLLAVLALVNDARGAAGLNLLRLDARLATAAGSYAQLMADRNWFNHTGPDGSTPIVRMMAAGLTNWSAWAENIAAGFTTPALVMAAWMNSPGHKANILNPALTHIGIGKGVKAGSQWGTYWVQDFAAVQGDPPPPLVTSITVSGGALSWTASPVHVSVDGHSLVVKT
jgi:uncharacterized protein YkwD